MQSSARIERRKLRTTNKLRNLLREEKVIGDLLKIAYFLMFGA
jgi:hypothetical protein